ncbi:UDP-glucose/GDP-mannose dehydrogenase family protein [Demequina sp. TTPB684]|uniref:UDP-glucose dehydrogenase family protein n=1 Tax=unclassified Demequina TaxID=2620311 RepID=UPI001CF49F63|nr:MULTISPECIES: UDP-glucose/GDP-mannose dehydrogenase family protein [unclassified Demequina]MCB2413292.1 UDP-glucose/GDP-mannose dehydrogenase family protein [Demequina sp. TTPB684]UPU88988.1 UDP-glucose/GDP-mannose dehydrogenase family protein [Demequina sp. TMPB413]
MASDNMQRHIPDRPKMTVIGTGYLGATHAVSMASLGFDVMGVDVDPGKIEKLAAGEVPFFEPGLPELLEEQLASGRLRFTTSFEEAAHFGDVHFVCVGTPQRKDGRGADLTYVEQAVSALAQHADRQALVIGKSTVPVGTAEKLTMLVDSITREPGVLEIAWNPEFLREGYAVEDTLHPDRLVFGVESAWAERMLRAVYAPVIDQGVPVVVADLPTAELVKVAANSYLATKISYINAMAEVCEASGADVQVLSEALGYDNRIGSLFLKPGLGFGGGCLPKDIRAFTARAEELGVGQAVEFLHQVDGINNRRRQRTVDLVSELLDGALPGARVVCLGATFKPNSDDVRDAPALDVARRLEEAGADVVVFDPEGMDNARRTHPQLTYSATFAESLKDADAVVLLTEWDKFKNADPEMMGELVRRRIVVDGRHALDADAYHRAGWVYRALGRPADVHSQMARQDALDKELSSV